MAEHFEKLNQEVIEFVRKASDLSGPYTLSLIEEQKEEEEEESDIN
jgi:hypothetical protein